MAGKRVMHRVLKAAVLALAGLILIGFLGRFWAVGDSLAVIRPLLAVLVLLLAGVLWAMSSKGPALVSLGVASLTLLSLVPHFVAKEGSCEESCLTLYQKNLLSRAWPRYELADDILASGAMIVTLQEDSDHNRTYLAKMFAQYPHGSTCAFRPSQRVTVLTRLPIVEGTAFCLPDAGLAGIQVLAPNGTPLWALSVHLDWPFPYDQPIQSQIIAAYIAQLEGPVLIAGDFNMVPWGGSVARIARAAGNERLGRQANTFNWGNPLLPLPIDMVFVPKGTGGTTELRPFIGSDHRGLLVRIDLRKGR